MKHILVTPRSFGAYNKQEMEDIFRAHDIVPVYNPHGQIMTQAQMKLALVGMDGIIIGVDPLTQDVLQEAPDLKAIVKYGVGLDNIDVAYAEKNGIAVRRTVGANANAVADYSFALLMAVARRIPEIDRGCHAGDWGKRVALDIYGKKIGILGLGAIGKGVARRAKGFGMEIYGYDVVEDAAFNAELGVHFTDVETIIRACDFLSIHLPLLPDTKHLLNKHTLQNAKETLIVVNTSRGGIIEENDLYELLRDGKLYGAGIDVFEEEPPANSMLLTLPNVVVGSHTAASTVGATQEMSRMAANEIVQCLEESH